MGILPIATSTQPRVNLSNHFPEDEEFWKYFQSTFSYLVPPPLVKIMVGELLQPMDCFQPPKFGISIPYKPLGSGQERVWVPSYKLLLVVVPMAKDHHFKYYATKTPICLHSWPTASYLSSTQEHLSSAK